MRWKTGLLLLSLVGLGGGCAASYITPRAGANLNSLGPPLGATAKIQAAGTPPTLQEQFDRQPLASFPASIAVVRIQESGYVSHTSESYGRGAFSVVTTRDVETDEQMARLTRLPMVAGISPVNRLLLPSDLTSEQDLRRAAATMRADMLLIYTFDTKFHVNDNARPLTFISFGFAPTKRALVTTTASAILIDTRSGYVYGMSEATDREEERASAWTRRDEVDRVRLETEADAFDKLVAQLEITWPGIVAQYAQPATPTPQ